MRLTEMSKGIPRRMAQLADLALIAVARWRRPVESMNPSLGADRPRGAAGRQRRSLIGER